MTAGPATYLAFALVCLLLLTLPFVPAFREWHRPTDFAALPVSANYTSDIDHFARRLHADAAARLGKGEPTGYEEFEFVTAAPEEMDWAQARQRLIARAGISTGEPIRTGQPLYVDGSFAAGPASAFGALYATGDIDLGEGSEIHDWAHADGVLRLSTNCGALRRVSAGVAVELHAGSWFERLGAPLLRFGSAAHRRPLPAMDEPESASLADLPGAIQQTPSLVLVRGDCALPSRSTFRGSLVVTGFLTIGSGTTVVGDVKARDGLSLGPGASVAGAITCEKRIYMFPHAMAYGPVTSESDILIGTSALIGLPDAPTTVSGLNIVVEEGAVVHGTLWAHEVGMVKQA